MFDIGAAELLLVAIVALVVIGPKDLPAAMRGVGRVLGQIRSVAGQFSFSLDAMIREAEMEDNEKEWAQRNADIMAKHPPADEGAENAGPASEEAHDERPSTDGEMKPLRPIVRDDGVMSSTGDMPSDDGPSQQKSDEHSEVPDDRQDDLFGDRT